MNPYDPDYLFFAAPVFIKPLICPSSVWADQQAREHAKLFGQGEPAPFVRQQDTKTTPPSKRDWFGAGRIAYPDYDVFSQPMGIDTTKPDPFVPRPFGADRHLVYLAGPMSGIEDHNAPEFSRYASALRDMGHFVFNPAEADMASGLINKEGTITDENRHKVLRADLLKILNDCHLVVAMPGWIHSRGARMEMAVALECGIDIAEIYISSTGNIRPLLPVGPARLKLLRSSFGPAKS